MALVKWTPMKELENLRRDMERLMDDFIEPVPRRYFRLWPTLERAEAHVPKIDLFERNNEFVVRAELPGIEKKDIDLTITNDSLSIKGETTRSDEVKEEEYYLSEITYGSFKRTIALPADVQSEKAKASFKNGVLEIILPQKEESKTKEIKVEVS